MPSANDDLSPTSSADEEGIDADGFSNVSGTSDDTSFPDSLNFSPTPRNSSIPVAKRRQSRSFKLDLSAQRTLLLDSQKLNQALKRCLSRTDELIADAKKALNYKVITEDAVNLGPRVLDPDEYDGESELGRGLLSPGLDEKLENPWERPRSVGDTWNVPQFDGSGDQRPGDAAQHRKDHGGNMAGFQARDMLGISYDGKPEADLEKMTPQLKKEELVADLQNIVDPLEEDFGIDAGTEILALESSAMPAGTAPSEEPRDTSDIPYEDPGIDTGGETSALEEDEKDTTPGVTPSESEQRDPLDQENVHDSSSDDGASTMEQEESRSLSPGKGLGTFLRMVGGSWGV